MEKKVELRVINITNSQDQAGAFAMLLGELNGERQLPIIIGPVEAQTTALYLKGIKTLRPLTHDLFMTTLTTLDCNLLRVLIYKAKEGIFYSYIYLKKDNEIIRIDARTSDAIALAIRANAPILIYDSILEQECLHISDDQPIPNQGKSDQKNINATNLEDRLEQAIKDENYELAAKIRDQINSKNQNQ